MRCIVLSLRRGTKLLGRDIQVIDIRPKDAYRYGYRLWLDEETAMPLRSVVSDGTGRPIEQIQFTRLEMKDRIPAKDIEPTVDATGFQWVRTGRKLAPCHSCPPTAWRPLRVPPGFRLVASRLQVMPGSPMPAQHLIFSDGIAAVSVFIEPGAPTGPRPPETSSMGSANAYSTSVEGHVVTAVGEVPAETVRDIASSVAPIRDPPATAAPLHWRNPDPDGRGGRHRRRGPRRPGHRRMPCRDLRLRLCQGGRGCTWRRIVGTNPWPFLRASPRSTLQAGRSSRLAVDDAQPAGGGGAPVPAAARRTAAGARRCCGPRRSPRVPASLVRGCGRPGAGWLVARPLGTGRSPSVSRRGLQRPGDTRNLVSAALVLYVREGCHLCEQFLLDFALDFPEAAAALKPP